MITQDAFIFPGDWKNPCHFENKKNGFRRFLLPDVSHATQELLNSQAALLESGATSYFHWCILLIEFHSLFIVYITNLTLFVENNSSYEWIVKIQWCQLFFLQIHNAHIRQNYSTFLHVNKNYRISAYSFRGNYSFFKVENVEIFI